MSKDHTSAVVKKVNKKDNTYTKVEYHIKINDFETEVYFLIGGVKVLYFKDYLLLKSTFPEEIINNLSYFKRTIKNNIYYYEDGQRSLIKIIQKSTAIAPLKETYFRSQKFVTYDIKTKTIGGEMFPYCVSIYDGNKFKTFYITDYSFNTVQEQSDALLKDSIYYLLKPKYSGYKVYVHNFSFFNGIFLMKIFS